MILTSKNKLHIIVHYCSFCISDFEMPEPKESISLIQQGCVECPAKRCENEMARDKAEWPKCFKCLICTTWVRPCLVTVGMSGLTLEKEFIQAFTVDHSWPLSHMAQWLYLIVHASNSEVWENKMHTCPGGSLQPPLGRDKTKINSPCKNETFLSSAQGEKWKTIPIQNPLISSEFSLFCLVCLFAYWKKIYLMI